MANPPCRILLICPDNLSERETGLAREVAASADLVVAVPRLTSSGGRPENLRILPMDALGSIAAGQRPDFVVYASPPAPALHRKIWWWKRRHAPGALWGGYWRPPPQPRWPDRLALSTLDFFFAANEADLAALRHAGVAPGRVLTNGEAADAGAITAFLGRRRAAEDRSVLWVEEDISLHSPSTKHLVYSVPHLREEGWEVRAWCLTTDVAADAVETRLLPAPPRAVRVLTPYWFWALSNGYGLGHWLLRGGKPARLVHTVGGAYLGADIAAIQFVNHVWLRKQVELGLPNLKAVLMVLWTLLAVLKDQLQFSNPRCRLFLPASDSIAEEVRRRCLARTEIEVLANSYDESRFNPAVRGKWREPMRRELGFGAGDMVFSFASQGHHKRKGFWLAVEALDRLRRREDVPRARDAKFLVIGGLPGTLDRLRGELTARHPGWEKWLVFVGVQAAVEHYLAAADAFLFPSYFEAFCLAEIEAGALGLPLLLTPHHGTEMILRPGENGLRLPFDPAAMEETLAGFLRDGLPPFAPSAGRALDRPAYARKLAGIYRRLIEHGPGAAAHGETFVQLP